MFMVENFKCFILIMIQILASIIQFRKAYILIRNKNNKSKWRKNKIILSFLLGSEFIIIPIIYRFIGNSDIDTLICNILGVFFVGTLLFNIINNKKYPDDIIVL